MDERTPKYTIANDYDPHGDLSADDDPLTEYLIYFCAIRSDGGGDLGFTLEDFERHIFELGKGTTGKASQFGMEAIRRRTDSRKKQPWFLSGLSKL